jgi:hypothetical protein
MSAAMLKKPGDLALVRNYIYGGVGRPSRMSKTVHMAARWGVGGRTQFCEDMSFCNRVKFNQGAEDGPLMSYEKLCRECVALVPADWRKFLSPTEQTS